MARESAEQADIRRRKLALLQEHYKSFAVFMRDMMGVLGFKPTWMQYDIANYLQYGPHDQMVQAQRGEAKSTITAIFAVFSLIHDPQHRVLIVSAGETQSIEIATLIQRLILTVPALECLRPDKSAGDRTSVDAFDIHHSLKGVDKSPSVACVGITGNLPGKRADLLIADDVESNKNSRTPTNREVLLAATLEFSAIATGRPGIPPRIVYLGTPQSGESIYNTLPGRGFSIRIWPGRYPTLKQRETYGEFLAPSLVQRLEADPSLAMGGGPLGDQGQPTDPDLFDEEKLTQKETRNGRSYFQLQYMLCTKLSDSERYPLKLEQCIGMMVGKRMPLSVTRSFDPRARQSYTSSGFGFMLASVHEASQDVAEFQGVHMYVDPAGGGANGDESAYAVTAFLNGNVYLLAVGGVPGGYDRSSLLKLAEVAARFSPNTITVEKNMGHGAFSAVWLPVLREVYKTASVKDEHVSGKKETRIIDTLEPVIGRGSFIIGESAIEEDDRTTEHLAGSGQRNMYSFFYQLKHITKDKGSLKKDDRIDAVAGSVRHWVKELAVDQEKAVEKEEARRWTEWFKDPTGHLRRTNNRMGPAKRGSTLDKYFRR